MIASILEKLKGWKTLLWNFFLVTIAPLLLYAISEAGSLDLSLYASPLVVYLIHVGIRGVDTWLRVITTGPVGSKGDEEPAPQTKAGD